jgi:CTD small phosphatase-like protein 2
LEDGCGQFLVRPYAENFIEEMSKYYELVIFTAALSDYADWILEKIDPNNLIKYKLYRQHCVSNGKNYIKVKLFIIKIKLCIYIRTYLNWEDKLREH